MAAPANFHRGAVADLGGCRGCAPPLRIFDDSYFVTPCPKLRDLGASHARLCLYTVGQTTDVPPPLETPASAPGVARLRPLWGGTEISILFSFLKKERKSGVVWGGQWGGQTLVYWPWPPLPTPCLRHCVRPSVRPSLTISFLRNNVNKFGQILTKLYIWTYVDITCISDEILSNIHED